MAKPEEVLVVENENGEVVREFMKVQKTLQSERGGRKNLHYHSTRGRVTSAAKTQMLTVFAGSALRFSQPILLTQKVL